MLLGILIIFAINFAEIQSKETTCIINGKKILNTVSEQFLSFSIDPATLLTGLNTSSTPVLLAKHLSPAFLRISGPSTQYVQFSQSEQVGSPLSVDSLMTVTPPIWQSFNEWVKGANLTPVFAINDKNRANAWNPKPMLPFFHINHKMDLDSYWQLGYDCGYKSLARYKEDLMVLRHVLEMYPPAKVVGSNLRSCFSNRNLEALHSTLEDLEGVADAVIWEQKLHASINPSSLQISPLPLWLVLPKVEQPVTFASGLLWAKQIGDAAKDGYKVVFRQPRLHEFFADTPVFWISLLHKTLVGRHVLDVKTNSVPIYGSHIYAYCSKRQNHYSRQGAMTVFVVNTGNYEHVASVRVASSHPKNIDVESYIITSNDRDITAAYLNGEKLTTDILKNGQLLFIPKLQRVQVNKLLNLKVPAKSVAFFVLPGAKLSVCMNRDYETDLFMDSLAADENFSLRGEENLELANSNGGIKPFSDLYNLVKQELDVDQEFYNANKKVASVELKKNSAKRLPSLKKAIKLQGDIVGNAITGQGFRQHLTNKSKTHLWKKQNKIDLPKALKPQRNKIGDALETKNVRQHTPYLLKKLQSDKQNETKFQKLQLSGTSTTKSLRNFLQPQWKKEDNPVTLEIVFTERPKSRYAFSNHTKKIELELTNDEVKKILTDRAKSGVSEKNIDVTSEELEDALSKAAQNLVEKDSGPLASRPKHKRFVIFKSMKRKPKKELFKKLKRRNREKRDINLEMLRQHVQNNPSSGRRTQQATLREFNRDSEQLYGSLKKPSEQRNIFLDLVEPWQEEIDSFETRKTGKKANHRGDLLLSMEDENEEKLRSGERYVDEKVQFLMGPGKIDSAVKAGSMNYHTFYENLDSIKFLNPNRFTTTKKPHKKDQVEAFLSKRSDQTSSSIDFTDDDLAEMLPWDDADQSGERLKRDTNSTIAISQIRNYKKNVTEQLRSMKKAKKQEDGNKLIIKGRTKPIQIEFKDEDSSKVEHLHIVIGKPHDPEKQVINERRRQNQERLLKKWLESRKKQIQKNREKKKQQNVTDIDVGKSKRKRSTYDFKRNSLYVPKAKSSSNDVKRYKSYTQKKPWKPQDILKIKRTPSYSVEDVDTREFLHRAAPMPRQKFRESRRYKRKSEDGIDSAENMIRDYSSDSIPKRKEHKKDFDNEVYIQTTTQKSLIGNVSTTVEAMKSNESTTATNLPKELVENATVTSSIDYCTSSYKKESNNEKLNESSSKSMENTKYFLDTIIGYMDNFFQTAFGDIFSLISNVGA